jgi:hypothetical protein
MNRLLALALLVPVMAVAGSPFDGTWKTRLDSVKVTGKPDVYLVSGGMFDCSSCVPPYKIKADGTDQAVVDTGYRDHIAVKILSPTAVELTAKKAGKTVYSGTMTVSADGSKLANSFTGYTGEKPAPFAFTETRTAPAAHGAHAVSGTWRQDDMSSMSDVASTVTLQSTPGGLKMTWNGQVTDAKFDGKEYLTSGDPGKTHVALKKMSDAQFEETDRREGKVYDVIVYTATADGKSISVVDTDPVHETKTVSIMDKVH